MLHLFPLLCSLSLSLYPSFSFTHLPFPYSISFPFLSLPLSLSLTLVLSLSILIFHLCSLKFLFYLPHPGFESLPKQDVFQIACHSQL